MSPNGIFHSGVDMELKEMIMLFYKYLLKIWFLTKLYKDKAGLHSLFVCGTMD